MQIDVKNNFAPYNVNINSTDQYGNLTDTSIVKGFRCYLKGSALDTTTTPEGKLYFWQFSENIQLKNEDATIIEHFSDINENGIWDKICYGPCSDSQYESKSECESNGKIWINRYFSKDDCEDSGGEWDDEAYIDANSNFQYDRGDSLVYFETALLDTITYTLKLTVNDGDISSESTEVNIEIIEVNTAPIVEGGTYNSTLEDSLVKLIATDITSPQSMTYDTTNTGQMLTYFCFQKNIHF